MSRFRCLVAFVVVSAPIACADSVFTHAGADHSYRAGPASKLGDSIHRVIDLRGARAPGLVDRSLIPVSQSFEPGPGGFMPGSNFVLESSAFSIDSSGNVTDSSERIDDWFSTVFANVNGFSTSGTAGKEGHLFAAQGAGSAFTNLNGLSTSGTTGNEASLFGSQGPASAFTKTISAGHHRPWSLSQRIGIS